MEPSVIVEHVSTFLELVGMMALIATLTPTKADDKFVQGIYTIIHTLAANVGKAKNKVD